MFNAPQELIDDLKVVFKKHDIEMFVADSYVGDEEIWGGFVVEIRSKTFDEVANEFPIFIDDKEIDEFAKRISE